MVGALHTSLGCWEALIVLGVLFAGLLVVAAVILAVYLARRKKGKAPDGGAAAPTPEPAAARPRCSQCGTPLAPDAPLGLCPKCVLKVGADSQEATRTSADTPHEVRGAVPFVPPRPEDLAPRFPQLEILELLGQGGMGAVYKARQPGLDRFVALKILPPSLGGDPTFAERFAREARSLARLSHPHIVMVHDFGQAGDLYYFLMEYVDGVSLRQMERSQKLAPQEALAIVPQVCEALQFAHDEGIVHRDIKPENILLDRKGRVKIADFGLAKLLARTPTDFTLTQPQQAMGTPAYMAPEQMERPAEVDQRADIYSLGVVFYEMLTGELPLGRFQPPSQKVQVDVRLDEVVLKALAKEPERRYQQASQVKTAVDAIGRAPQTPPAPQAGAAPAAGRPRRWTGVIVAAVVAVVLVGLMGLVLVPVAFLFLARVANVQTPVTDLRRYPLDSLEGVITASGVELDTTTSTDGGGSLKIAADGPTVVRLFETGPVDAENARLTYQARLRTQEVQGPVYLEMWCHLPGQGESFSRGIDDPLTGTTEWTTAETPFLLKQGQRPDNVKLNLVIGGKGTVWIDDVRLLKGPLR